MREQLQRRLEELKKEFTTGRARAEELEQQRATLNQTLLRISGAIQVLEEELKAAPSQEVAPVDAAAHAEPTRVNGSLDRVAT